MGPPDPLHGRRTDPLNRGHAPDAPVRGGGRFAMQRRADNQLHLARVNDSRTPRARGIASEGLHTSLRETRTPLIYKNRINILGVTFSYWGSFSPLPRKCTACGFDFTDATSDGSLGASR